MKVKENDSLGSMIKKYRKEQGLTQEELATKCDTSAQYIGLLEINKRQPSMPFLKKLTDALDIELKDIMPSLRIDKTKGRQPKINKSLNRINALLEKLPEKELNRIFKLLKMILKK